jgi:hypothetical protein
MKLKIIIQKEVSSIAQAKTALALVKTKLAEIADIEYSANLSVTKADIETS